jgi:hypothetical protein
MRAAARQAAGIIDAHVPAPVAPLVAEPAEPDADDPPGLADRVASLEAVVGDHLAHHAPNAAEHMPLPDNPATAGEHP